VKQQSVLDDLLLAKPMLTAQLHELAQTGEHVFCMFDEFLPKMLTSRCYQFSAIKGPLPKSHKHAARK
jgi:hypothetical protein